MSELFLDRYEAIQYLGHGSMGQVYLARPVDVPEALVVVKLMHDHVANQPRFRQLFEREIQSMMGLAHPYIVRLIDASTKDSSTPCLVMEYIQGVGLEQLLKEKKRLTPERVGMLLGFLCHALSSAHERGIVHRDLKPANLMVVNVDTEWEGLRVMDFGLSKMTSKPHLTPERLSGVGGVVAQGTPNYLCPDQLRGDEIDGRADIYSVGVILYEMLTGRLPFVYYQPQPLLNAHLNEKPPAFTQIGITDIPPRVEEVVQHCLGKYPNERPQNAESLAFAYSTALGLDIWEYAQPSSSQLREPLLADPASVEESTDGAQHRLEAWMPERMASVKLGGFIRDLGGKILQSDPGLLKVQIGEPDPGGWMLSLGLRKPKFDPILIDFRLRKPDPSASRLEILVRFHPLPGHPLRDPLRWSAACQALLTELKGYLLVKS